MRLTPLHSCSLVVPPFFINREIQALNKDPKLALALSNLIGDNLDKCPS